MCLPAPRGIKDPLLAASKAISLGADRGLKSSHFISGAIYFSTKMQKLLCSICQLGQLLNQVRKVMRTLVIIFVNYFLLCS